MAKVDVVKVKNSADWSPAEHHAVEQEDTGKLLFQCDTQAEAIKWAKAQGYDINVHRERNRKSSDSHGQFRKQ